ncbi:hypothetical protein LINGRAHAP2_LOCUS31835 [Linum grandiflorum]
MSSVWSVRFAQIRRLILSCFIIAWLICGDHFEGCGSKNWKITVYCFDFFICWIYGGSSIMGHGHMIHGL